MEICFLADADSIIVKRWVETFKKDFDISLITFGKNSIPGIEQYHMEQHYLSRLLPFTPNIVSIKGGKSQIHKVFWPYSQFNVPDLVRRLIKKINPDVVHGHYLTSYGYIATCSNKHPIINTLWGSDIYILPGRDKYHRKIAEFALKGSDMITVVAKDMVRYVREFGIDESRIKYIPICTDTSLFDPKKVHSATELERTEGGNLILSLRELSPLYDIETVIDAFSLVIKEESSTTLLIGNTGVSEMKLKEKAERMNLCDNIKFLGEFEYEKIPQLISVSDICVSAALSDGAPNTIMECMAMEKPVIATNVGGVPEIVDDGKNGFLIPIKSPRVLADRMLFLIRNEKKARLMGKKARKKIIKDFNWEIWSKKMKRVYSDL